MPSLKEIRAKLAAQENKSKKTFAPGDSQIYPHWNIAEDTTAGVRFLNDADENNPYFWVERNLFKFPFNGVKGSTKHNVEPSSAEVVVQIPCMEMYDEKDPVLDEVRTWFKDPTMEDMGRKYWKKRSYFFQGFVNEDPMEGTEGYVTPENPIRRFTISPQIFGLIKSSLMDPDIEELPTDEKAGLDFKIKKTTKGSYADYSSSTWARKESAISEEQLAAIEKHGLYDLKSFLPAKPTENVLKVIMEMFEASVEGEAYDVEKWGQYFTPFGIKKVDAKDANATAVVEDKRAEKLDVKSDDIPFDTEKTTEEVAATVEDKVEEVKEEKVEEKSSGDDKAQDILKMIRSRQKA